MKLSNQKTFEKEMLKRNWDAKAYLEEASRFNDECVGVSKLGDHLYVEGDTFTVVKEGTFLVENEKTGERKTCTRSAISGDWEIVQNVEEVVFRFEI